MTRFLLSKKKNKRTKSAVSTVMVSILAVAAIVAIMGTTSVSSAAFDGAPGAVYTIDNSATGNNVLVYARGPNGHLSPAGTFSTQGLGTGAGLGRQGAVVLTQDGQWLLVVDAGSNQITVFGVHGTTLKFASITSSHGDDPISLTVSRNLVYVLDAAGSGNIAGFRLSEAGVLSYIPGSAQPLSRAAAPSPEQIGFNPRGNILVVTEKGTNTIDTYTVDHNGVANPPTSQTSAGSGPYGFAFTNQNQLIVSEAASNSLSSYLLSSDGLLRTISGAIPTFGLAPCWVVIGNNGQFAYTTNAHGGTISTFAISHSGGLRLMSSIAAQTAIPALDMAFSNNGHFLYVHNGNDITGYQVFSNGGLLTVTSVRGLPAATTGLGAN